MPTISTVTTEAQCLVIRRLLGEYQRGVERLLNGTDVCPWFNDLDTELVQLDSIYQTPGILLLAQADDGARLGCVGLRSLPAASNPPGTAEVRRLFVREQGRGTGLGRQLARQLVTHAQAASLSHLVLNTLPAMTEAQALYSSMGFERCEPYVDEPLDGVLYYSLSL